MRRPSATLAGLALLLPALLMVGLLFVYPLAFSLTYAFRNEATGGWDLGNFTKAFALYGNDIALTAGVTSTPRICASYGEDAYDIADEQREYLERAGAPLLYASGGQQAVQAIMAAMGGPTTPAAAGTGNDDEQNDQ